MVEVRKTGSDRPCLRSIGRGFALALPLGMDAGLAIKGLSYGIVALLAVALLALSLVSLRKEIQTGRSLMGLFPVALLISVLCALIALYTAYLRVHRARSTVMHFDRTSITGDGSDVDYDHGVNERQVL